MSVKNNARESFKNTGLVGGSQVVTILINIVKTKLVAILLGPSGMGLIQLLASTITLVKSVSGLGIGFSGVRDIAQSIGSGDDEKIGKTIVTLKRWSWVTGILGVSLTILFSQQLSVWTFGNKDYWLEISLLSSTIILSNIAGSYVAIIRGARRTADYVKLNIFTAFFGAILAIVIYYFLGERGILPVLILTGIIGFLVNYFYSRKISFQKVNITYKESFFDGLDMVKLGAFTVLTGFISEFALYYVRISINDNLGIEFVGYYAVATTLAVTYMGLIFTAMGVDYFPKLSAINTDNKALNLAVLEQTKIILLLGTPLILGMYTFSEYLIQILYTKDFGLALPLLMWMLLSVFLRLIGFPIGFVFLAKGKSKIFIFTQSLWNIIFVSFAYFSWQLRGDLVGIGMAFTSAYVIGVLLNIIIIKKMTKLKYDTNTLTYIGLFSIITLLYFFISYYDFNEWYFLVFKIIGVVLLSLYCFNQIEKLIGLNVLMFIKTKLKK